jgi:hypothetical protein
VANHRAPAPTNDWPSDAGAIAHVQIYAAQRAAPVAESGRVGNIEGPDRFADTRYPTAGARMECSTGSASKRMPAMAIDFCSGITRRSETGQAGSDRHVRGRRPGRGRPWTRPPAWSGWACVKRMAVGEICERKDVQPVGATIDHNLGFPAGDDDAAVASVKSRARSNPPRVPRKVIATNSREPRCALSAICRGRTIRLLQRKLVQDPAGACCV